MTDVCLRPFIDANLQVNRVADNVSFDRFQLGEDVTVVVVKVAYCSFIGKQTVVEELLVIDIAFLQAQLLVQTICRIERVANPLDIANVILLTFLNIDVDVNITFFFCRNYTV